MNQKCASCGSNISMQDEVCSYCGTPNPDYRPPGQRLNQLLEQGMDAFQSARFAEAVDCYQQAVNIEPEMFEPYFYLAASYSALKRYEDAIQAMQKAQTLRPDNAPIYLNLGILCKQAGRREEAQTYLEKALEVAQSQPSRDSQDQLIQNILKELSEFKRKKRFGIF
ncbi:MAG: tetratricopeptide repeat protein [Chloroflexota bacterium]